jgi:hypothetical protein
MRLMKIPILTALALVGADLMPAQDEAVNALIKQKIEEKYANPQANMVSAVIPVKTLTGDAFQRLVNLLKAFKVSYQADDRLRTILVYAPKDVVEQMKKVVLELDRPGSEAAVGRNVDLTLTFLRCTTKVSGEAPPALPADLEAVAKQLRAATHYKQVELWDVIPMRIQEGKQTDQSARLPGKAFAGANPMAHIRLNPDSVSQRDGGRSLRFDHFNINFRLPYGTTTQFNMMEVGINTSGDFKEGQKTVLGKVGLDDESAVFVVVALKIVD